jgi:integrase/recombinase XerD
MPGKRVANPPKLRGHSAIAQSHPDLAQVIVQTVRLWRKAHLDYDQTKYVVE